MEQQKRMPQSVEWRPFPGFEECYLVSNKGDVFSVRTNRLLKAKPNQAGYLRVSPSVNGVRSDVAIHRAVALAFIPNPDKKLTVNHINEDKTDNTVDNLEWATNAEQNVHGTRIERVRAHTDYKNRGIDYSVVAAKHDYQNMNKKQMKPVLQFDKYGSFIARHEGLSEASRNVGISASHLCCCLKGRRKSCGGFIWKYA